MIPTRNLLELSMLSWGSVCLFVFFFVLVLNFKSMSQKPNFSAIVHLKGSAVTSIFKWLSRLFDMIKL